jgi:hypothetical protein
MIHPRDYPDNSLRGCMRLARADDANIIVAPDLETLRHVRMTASRVAKRADHSDASQFEGR